MSEQIQRLLQQGQKSFKRRLAADQVDSGRRLLKVYRGALKDQVDKRLKDLRVLAQAEGMTGKALANEAAVVRLRDSVQQALDGVSATIEGEAQAMQHEGIRAGNAVSTAMLEMTLDDVNRPLVGKVKQAINIVDSPAFQQTLAGYSKYHAEAVSNIIYNGAAEGKHPSTLARMVTSYLQDYPLADAIRMTRTVLIVSARRSAHETFRANSDVVTGWIWVSALTPNTCAGCWAMHGTLHSLDEELNDHHAGLCTPVPVTKTWADFGFDDGSEVTDGIQSGEDIFAGLPEDQQRQILGAARWSAYQDGLFDFSQLSTTYEDPVYGTMRKAASLDSLIGSQAAALYKRPAA